MLPLITSPRISFSHDLNIEEDDEKVEVKMEEDQEDQEDSSSMDVSDILDNDHEGQLFDFSFSDSFTFEPSSSSADELFSDGLIRPLQLEEKFVTTSKHASVPPTLSQNSSTNDDPSLLKDANVVATMSTAANVVESSEHKNQNQANSKSFWKINRSSSVHVDEDSYKKSSFWSLPLMLRSNSTGSAPSPRQISKENKKHNMQKQLKCSTASSSSFYMYQLSQKPPLKRNHGGSYSNNGVFTNPVLNVPPPYIGKGTGNLFGITSLFKEKKDKKIKK
ncbi:hypothetical protein ACET3Z_020777 [Daucus carota]